MIASEISVQVARKHRLGSRAQKFLVKFAQRGDDAPIHEVLGVRISELPRLNAAMADISDLKTAVSNG